MGIVYKILEIFFILLVTFFWNKYVVTFIVSKVANFHKIFNKNNLDKQPIKFLIKNELNIIKVAQYFYWLGAIIIVFEILTN